MIKGLLSLYTPKYLVSLTYMLQNTEYQAGAYLRWYWRTKNYTQVMKRRVLEPTRPARLLLSALRLLALLQIGLGLVLIYLGIADGLVGGITFGIAVIIAYPAMVAHLILLPLIFGRFFITQPAEKKLIKRTKSTFKEHPAVKIAVAGSYGKTTMKELLATVLAEGLKVSATPANKNVAISHARFAAKLTGDEDVLIIEYGEGAPGDVAKFAQATQPTHAIITGLAPAHLDRYKTLDAAGHDIFSVADYLGDKNVYVNQDSPELASYIKPEHHKFNSRGALGWKVSDVEVSFDGTSFGLTKGKKTLNLHSGLVGRHQIGFLALVAGLALELGLTQKQVVDGISKTAPFEHRMQPYELAGAQIIDDSYNGNLEGIRAGTQLLKELPANRKIYVTPGLVDQGAQSDRVHLEVGKLIANANPNLVVLMKNSATKAIKSGLKEGGFAGEVRIETNPLEFYTNLAHFVAKGDLLVMQNDWTDNYA